MHKFMRAIGFSHIESRKKLQELLTEVVMNADYRGITLNQENRLLGEFCKDFSNGLGIAVCGGFDEDEKFTYEYYFPYLSGTGITTSEDISVERHAERDSFAGVCDDLNAGMTLIFFLKNSIPYVKAQATGRLPVAGTTLTLSALSVQGTVILSLHKEEYQVNTIKKSRMERKSLLAAARKGDEEAIETLTAEDMDTYNLISKRVHKEDIYNIVDTFFMPYGVECDHYSIMGEIVAMRMTTNHITGEQVYVLTLSCNELTFDVAINTLDLYGEPQVGRRFKGTIWLQGQINFPEDSL